MANATSNIPLKPPMPSTTGPDDTLTAPLSTKRPKLEASFTEGASLGGVRDVRVNGESVVERKVANIELGDGLEKNGNTVSIIPESYLQFVTINALAGQLTEVELQTLQNNRTNRIVYNNVFYQLTQIINGQRIYFTANPSSELNEIHVDMETGQYQVINIAPVHLAEHIADTVSHITDAERQYWNDKVTTEIQLDAESGDHILKFIK